MAICGSAISGAEMKMKNNRRNEISAIIEAVIENNQRENNENGNNNERMK
jgi:hypothetical protein